MESNSSAHSDQEEEDEQMNEDDEGPTMVTLRTGHNDSYNLNQEERVREISATELEATQMTKEDKNTVHKGVIKGQQSMHKFFMRSPNKESILPE